MKKIIISLLAGLMAVTAFAGCTNNSGSTSDGSPAASAASDNGTSKQYEAPADGEKIPVNDSKIYSVLTFADKQDDGFESLTVTVNADCMIGKKGQTMKHYFDPSSGQEGIVFIEDGKETGIQFTDYGAKKQYTYSVKEGKYYTSDYDSDGPQKYGLKYLPQEPDKDYTFEMKDGFYVYSYTYGSDGGNNYKYEYKYKYDDESGNIRMILSTEDQVDIDVTIVPETVGKNGAASLRDSVFDFVDTKDEVAPPDFSDPTMYDVTGVIDGSFTDNYFKSAEVIKKGTQS